MTSVKFFFGAPAPITAVSFGSIFKYNSRLPTHTVRGDSWAFGWTDSSKLIVASDDSFGWDESLAPSGRNMMIGELSDATLDLVGTDVNDMSEFGTQGQSGSDGTGYSYKLSGMIAVDGALYCFLARHKYIAAGTSPNPIQQTTSGGQIIKSSDDGVTWTPLPPSTANPYVSPMFPEANFSGGTFVDFGTQDYQGNTTHNSGLYVYAISTDGVWNNGNSLQLGRCLRTALPNLSRADWQFYTGGDGMLDGSWSSDLTSATTIISEALSVGVSTMYYVSVAKRFILFTWHYPSVPESGTVVPTSSVWDIYEGPTPWEMTKIQTDTWSGLYNPAIIPSSVAVTESGVDVMIAASGNYTTYTNPNGEYTLTLIPASIAF